MITVTQCVVCDGPIRNLKHALVAPFLAARIWGRNSFLVRLVKCMSCGFLFYNPRLDDADLRRLYHKYRSGEYQQMRNASEIWYSNKFNYDLASPASYALRQAKLRPILKAELDRRKIGRVLDHGGDRGDLVAGLIEGTEAFVYDISGVEPAAGVTAVTNLSDCEPDLIVNSNVLEHVGFPRDLVAAILREATKGTLVFLEVPCEKPFGASRLARRIAQIGIMALTRPAQAKHVLRPSAFFMMHEHINYYTEQTLALLMKTSGGNVLASGSYSMSSRAGNADMAWCLASKP